MADPARRTVAYEDLYAIPEHMTGEILGGELVATPRPSRRHAFAASSLDKKIGPFYQFGEGGAPGGWIILFEPEIKLGNDLVVPDLAGWRKERFPFDEEHNWISAAPQWICEVLSPSTVHADKIRKMPIYARYGVEHIWLVDPAVRSMDVFKLELGRWFLLGSYAGDDKVRAGPFQEIEFDLGCLWIDSMRPPVP